MSPVTAKNAFSLKSVVTKLKLLFKLRLCHPLLVSEIPEVVKYFQLFTYHI